MTADSLCLHLLLLLRNSKDTRKLLCFLEPQSSRLYSGVINSILTTSQASWGRAVGLGVGSTNSDHNKVPLGDCGSITITLEPHLDCDCNLDTP